MFWSRKRAAAAPAGAAAGELSGRAAAGWRDAGRPPIEDDPLVGYLVRKGIINRETGTSVSMEARVTGQRAGDILVRQAFVPPDVLVRAMIDHNPEDLAGQRLASTLVPPDELREHKIVVAAVEGRTIYVASPSDEEVVASVVGAHYPGFRVEFVAYEPDALEPFVREVERVRRGGAPNTGAGPDPVARLLSKAIDEEASDVHVEPKERSYSVMFRKLGVRVHAYEGSLEEHNVLLTRIKDRSHMDISLTEEDQDGSFRFEHAGRTFDVRTVTIPSTRGEKLVMRILDPNKVKPSLESLGITRLEHWRTAVSRKNGICLVVGETGSGKTNTMHCTLANEDRFGDAIYTVENPVEIESAYVTQVGVNDAAGMTAERAVRSFMRGDPDTVVVGEIRDPVTCQVAIAAAETGHMVIGTVHANDVRGAVARLVSLGAPEYKVVNVLRGALVQTLVRTVCRTCGGGGTVAGARCHNPVCGGVGYDGRTIISECASFDTAEAVEAVMRSSRAVDWPTMLDDAIGKMREGVTTSDEVQSHFGAEFERRARDLGVDPRDHSLKAVAARDPR